MQPGTEWKPGARTLRRRCLCERVISALRARIAVDQGRFNKAIYVPVFEVRCNRMKTLDYFKSARTYWFRAMMLQLQMF